MRIPPLLANLAWAASSWPAARQFHRALAQPAETQLAWLRDRLARDAGCAYGRRHGFASIQGYEDFRQRVPLIDYDELEPLIGQIRRGAQAVLTTEPVLRLVPTSGSSGARKLIPFTAGLQRDLNRALGPWIADLFRQIPGIAFGPAYWSITPAILHEAAEDSVVPVGFDDDSRYLGGARHRLMESLLLAPSALRFVSDMETFRYLTLFCLLRQPGLRLISIWHPSFLTLLLEALPKLWEELLRDLHSGECRRAAVLPSFVQEALRLERSPRRSRELGLADPSRPETLWPALKVISCWGDGHAEAGAKELQRCFPHTLIQAKGLLATEAFVTIPYKCCRPLAICSHFFEFIDEDGVIHLAHQVREGRCYDVAVTTAGGLWRYRLWDRLQVTGFLGRTPALRFLGKSNSVADRFGEKLSEVFVGQVIRELLADSPTPPRFAMLAPDEDQAGWRYVLYLAGESAAGLAERLDTSLRRNPHYAWCRDLGQLRPPRVITVHADGYEAFVAREMQSGRRLGEIKPVALSAQTNWSRYLRCQPTPRP